MTITKYAIRDRAGELVAWHERIDEPGGKRFVWRLPSGKAGLNGTAVADLPLFGIHHAGEWTESTTVVVAEGEKATTALLGRDVPAVGVVTGAATVPSTKSLADLTGRHVALWPDADEPGHKLMDAVASGLCGVAATVRMVTPPNGVAKGWDAADAVAEGVDPWDLVDAAELVKPPPALGLDLAEFLARGDQIVHWHVDGAIVRGAFVQWLGLWESFKSMGLLHLGACSASGLPWLDMAVEERPFLYVSNEKSPETIRDRLRHIVAPAMLRQRIVIVHRAGVRFDRKWDEVVKLAAELGEPFVGLDTLSSLAPAGFDENRSQHMSVALDAIRELTTHGSTVALAHHPSKAAGGVGRGHGSLDGEIDGTIEFDRPEKDKPGVVLAIRPKDGDHRRVRLVFNPETFLLELDVIGPAATATEVARTVRALFHELGRPVKASEVRAEYPNYGDRVIRERLAEARDAEMIRQFGAGPTTAYGPPREANDDD